MTLHSITCKAVEVRTDSGICPGLARTRQGEEYLIGGRTPAAPGMCTNALCALGNTAYVMMVTDARPGEKDGCADRVCPHGAVTFRLRRSPGEQLAAGRPFQDRPR